MKNILLISIILLSIASIADAQNKLAADVNNDGTVDIADVNSVINIICGNDTTISFDPLSLGYYDDIPYYFNLENPTVLSYLNDVEYPSDDYTYSSIDDYLGETSYNKECPFGVRLTWNGAADSLIVSESADFTDCFKYKLNVGATDFIIYNLIPGRKYYWKSMLNGSIVKSSHFFTIGSLRAIKLKEVHNIRDIGGIPTSDGRSIIYNKVFRGGTLEHSTVNDKSILIDTLGITSEINLIAEDTLKKSPYLGNTVDYSSFTGKHVNYLITKNNDIYNYFGSVLHKLLSYLEDGKVVYVHCGGGADRTGAIFILLEGLLGCSESDIAKDYEITSFSIYGKRKRIDGVAYGDQIYKYASAIRYIKLSEGSTFQKKVISYLAKCGVTSDEVKRLQELLLK